MTRGAIACTRRAGDGRGTTLALECRDMTEQTVHTSASHEFLCENCGRRFELVRHRKARWIAAGTGALLGVIATENLVGAVLCGAIVYAAAVALDRYHFGRLCPQCGTVAHPAHNGADKVEQPSIVTEASP